MLSYDALEVSIHSMRSNQNSLNFVALRLVEILEIGESTTLNLH